MKNPNKKFWQDKKVLLTGHTGFKGAWLTLWLQQMGAQVTGISLEANTTPNLVSELNLQNICNSNICDIRDAEKLAALIKEANPDIVFHLAAQALVRESYQNPLETFDTNVMGTANLLNGMRSLDNLSSVVMVTTDKVYRNNEWTYPYREDDALGGHDPYSASKAASEIVINSYKESFLAEKGIPVSSARAGNVIGGGDWSADRLIPDAVRAWEAKETLEIRRPDAIRPWQHVLEPLAGYMILAEKLAGKTAQAGAYNFGPETSEAVPVRTVIELANKTYTKGDVAFGDGLEGVHEAGRLSLEIAKSVEILGVKPRWNLETAIEKTMSWYKAYYEGADAITLCNNQIKSFEQHSTVNSV